MDNLKKSISVVSALLCAFHSASILADNSQIKAANEADALKSTIPQKTKHSSAVSEFDHQSPEFVKNWRHSITAKDYLNAEGSLDAEGSLEAEGSLGVKGYLNSEGLLGAESSLIQNEYEDTGFGELIYNEPSTPTKLEILRLLSKDTPSLMVYLTALSMGNDIESLLQASIDYAPSNKRDLASSAVILSPYLDVSDQQRYATYELEDLNREDNKPYSVNEVINNFFEDGSALRPYPDWFAGQFHFLASAQELSKLDFLEQKNRWFRTKNIRDNNKRPIFISLYKNNKAILIDDKDRVLDALKEDSDALVPVVFIYNQRNERAIDQLDYPQTLKGVQQAYADKRLMLTPVPEWQFGEYHLYAELGEFYELFDIPEEDDFEPEAWQKLLSEAKKYSVNKTSFIFVVLPQSDNDTNRNSEKLNPKDTAKGLNTQFNFIHPNYTLPKMASTQSNQQYAVWDDPRTESAFPFATTENNESLNLQNILDRGLIFNRPDLIAALNALGVKNVPVAFYYFDESRVKPFRKNPRVLVQAAIGLTNPNGWYGASGGISGTEGGIVVPPPEPPICASPPCTE